MVWNAVTTGRNGVPAGDMTGVVVRNNGVVTNEAQRAYKEAGCGAATGVTKKGGVGATAACNAAITG